MSEALVLALDSISGWSVNGGVSVELQGADQDLIAGEHESSVAMRVPSGSAGAYAYVSIAFDASEYEWASVSMASLRAGNGGISKASDAAYALELADGQTFYVPSYSTMERIRVPLDGFSVIRRLKITVLHGGQDYLVLSDFRVHSGSGITSDLLLGVKSGMERESSRLLGPGREIGTVTASAGDTNVTVDTDWRWLERNVVLQIGSGVRAERHQLLNVRDNMASLMPGFDGASLLRDHARAPAYVVIPVEVGYYDREADLPGITLWYSSPSPQERRSRASREVICVGPLGTYIMRDGMTSRWRVLVEIAARSPELVADGSAAVRSFLAGSRIWVHGAKLWFDWSEPSSDSEPVEGYDIVPRASYAFDVDVREDSWRLERLATGSPSLTVVPSA